MNTFLTILGFVLLVAGIVLFIVFKINDKNKAIPLFMGVAGIVIFLVGLTWVIIPSGKVGVKVTLGQVKQEVYSPGQTFKIPFVDEMKLVSTKQQDIEFNEQVWGETKTQTPVYYEMVTVTYRVVPDSASWIVANVASYQDQLITQKMAASSIKTASKTLTDQEATNRGVIEPLIVEYLQKSVNAKYGQNVVEIVSAFVGNADFEPEYNAAIAEKNNARVALETQQVNNQKAIEQAEADQKIREINAQTDYDVKLKNAQADADSMLEKAKAEKEAYQLMSEGLTKEVLQKMLYEQWNGEMPEVVGDGFEYFLDVKEYTEDKAPAVIVEDEAE